MKKILFEINDKYNNINKSCKAGFDLFNLNFIANYDKILYLDIYISVKNDILCVLEKGFNGQ